MPHESNPIDASRDPERGGTPTRDMRASTFCALLLAFFAVGFVMTLRVREVAGIRAARRDERETALAG